MYNNHHHHHLDPTPVKKEKKNGLLLFKVLFNKRKEVPFPSTKRQMGVGHNEANKLNS